MKKKTIPSKTLIICQTMSNVIDLKENLGKPFEELPNFKFESDDYILMYGISFHICVDGPKKLKQVYKHRFRKYIQRKEVTTIVWYSEKHSDFIDAVMAFRMVIGEIDKKEYVYYGEPIEGEYRLYPKLLEEL